MLCCVVWSNRQNQMPSINHLVSEVIQVNAWLLNDKGEGSVVKYGW